MMQFQALRDHMVNTQLLGHGITDQRLLKAMRRIPRHEFALLPYRSYRYHAYTDRTLPLPHQQRMSQPLVVALMVQALHLEGDERVLEVGTGSGYQTAILCELAGQVYSLERHGDMADRASVILEKLGCDNLDLHIGDGSQGLLDMAPFDAIIVNAAAPALPGPLRLQMHPDGGCMVLPIGTGKGQYLEIITRHGNRWEMERTRRVRFDPLIGLYGAREEQERPAET
ncbi:MAG: protein-L-isoaspartate(D-aspartate) O-methyltransferase [Anaerolineae bacterium]|nr:protein-L-isoaspartate(D-aspartate) O-methyltransferase [Anaerolineae bacterium]